MQTGREHKDAVYNGEVCQDLMYLRLIFAEMSGGRQSGGFGMNPLTWEGIQAYCNLMGVELSPSETRVIKRIDAAYLSVTSERKK